jgi:hypothetical protein
VQQKRLLRAIIRERSRNGFFFIILPKLAWGAGPPAKPVVEGRRWHTAVCDGGPSTMLRMVPLPI